MKLSELIEMCEGNYGARITIRELLPDDNCEQYLKRLIELGITGWKIWVCYKDICKKNIETFKNKLLDGSILEELKQTPDWKYYENNNQ